MSRIEEHTEESNQKFLFSYKKSNSTDTNTKAYISVEDFAALIAQDEELEDMLDELIDTYRKEYERAGQQETDNISSLADVTIEKFTGLANYTEYIIDIAKKINKVTTDKIKKEVDRAQENDSSKDELLDSVANSAAFSSGRAQTIARTETSRVINQAKNEAMKQAGEQGVRSVKTWISEDDERVREAHLELDGTTIPVDADFVSSGGSAAGPGQFGIPEEDINCRCIIIAQIAD